MQYSEITKSGVHFLTEPFRVPSGTHLRAEDGCRRSAASRFPTLPYAMTAYTFAICKKRGLPLRVLCPVDSAEVSHLPTASFS